jgi:hypothetical protein
MCGPTSIEEATIMKRTNRKFLPRALLGALLLFAIQASAAPFLTLLPVPEKIHPNPLSAFSVELVLSGLFKGPGTIRVGAFDLDLSFGPIAFSPSGAPSIAFLPASSSIGSALGGVDERVIDFSYDNAFGTIRFSEISLLETDLGACLAHRPASDCGGPFLSDLQRDTISLGVLSFVAFGEAIHVGALHVAVEAMVFADGDGARIEAVEHQDAVIAVPLPSTAWLSMVGLLAWSAPLAWRRDRTLRRGARKLAGCMA